MHGVDRFSEALDFSLKDPDPSFNLDQHLDAIKEQMTIFGFNIEVSGIGKSESNVSARFLKDDSLKKLLKFTHYSDIHKKIKIKIEVDKNPPAGADTVSSFVDFPTDFAIRTHDLPSLFAGKCHALLCRNYVKGRDWFDFSWYVSNRVKINYQLLSNALNQVGPWQNQKAKVDELWLKRELLGRVQEVEWPEALRDMSRFVRSDQTESLSFWGQELFTAKVQKMFEI